MLETAKKTALSRDGIRAFAKTLDVPAAKKALSVAIDEAGAHAATVLAFGLAARGEVLDPKVLRALAPEVDELDHLGVLMRSAEGDFVDVIVATLGDDTISTTRSTYLVLLAADALGDRPAPEKLRTKARHLARHDLDVTPSVCLGVASQILKDADLTLLASPFIKESKRYKRTVDELLSASKLSPIDVLPEIAAPRVTARMTVRKGPEPGRNDACPCGSGQKYKKCCANKPQAAVEEDGLDASTLRKEQITTLRPSEIARLDFSKLSNAALAVVPRRAARLGKWAAALEAIEVAKGRKELADQIDDLLLETLSYALDVGAVEASETLLAAVREGKPEAETPVELALIKKDGAALDLLESAMHRALEREGDGAHMIDIAYAMLKHRPALGILLARGAIHERRPNDSMQLMQEIEDARDRLLLPPFEAWWDVFDFMMKGVKKPAAARKKDDAPDLKGELRRARAASRKASTEIDKLKKRLEEVDAQIALTPKKKASPTLSTEAKKEPAPVDDALAEERRRLKNKVEEMQRIIGEGQEERRELKKQLAEAAAVAPVSASPEAPREEDEEEEEEGTESPRGVLIPSFTDRAGKALADLDAPIADVVLGVIAGLAAARENAWFGVKRLEKARTVYSARAGIHYRVLFMIEDGLLRVYEVFHRRDLESAVNRMMKLSNPRS